MGANQLVQGAKAVRLVADPDDPMTSRPLPSRCNVSPIPEHDRPLISVVMTSYNSEAYIEAALQSLLEQSYSDLDIIVVDDCSADSTREKVSALAGLDRRIRLLVLPENRGTYWAKNAGIILSRGQIVTFMDSDDVAHPIRIQRQFEAIRPAGVVASTARYVRVFGDGGVRESKRHGLITLMVRREVFDSIGYFDSVRTSADEEFFLRVKLAFGQCAVANVNEALYIARVRADSLSMDPRNPAISEQTGGLSPVRMHYFQSFKVWHDSAFEKQRIPFVSFPLYSRPFDVDPMLLPGGGGGDGRDSVSVIIDTRSGVSESGAELLREVRQTAHKVFLLSDGTLSAQANGDARVLDVAFEQADALDGVRVSPGRVAVLDASYHYPAGFLRELLYWGEFAPNEAVVGCRLERPPLVPLTRHMSEVDSLLLGALTFHTDALTEEAGDERILRLDILASMPFLSVKSLSGRISVPAGVGTLRLLSRHASARQPLVQQKQRSSATGSQPVGSPESDVSAVRAVSGTRSNSLPTDMPAGPSLRLSKKPGVLAKTRMLIVETRTLLRLLLVPWSGVELALLGGAFFAALALFTGLVSVAGIPGAAGAAVCVLFIGLTLVFVGRRVRVSVTGLGGMNPKDAVRAQFWRIRRIFRSGGARRKPPAPLSVVAQSSSVHTEESSSAARILRQFGSEALVALRRENYKAALGLWTDAVRLSRISSSDRKIVELLGAAFAAAAGEQFRARMLALGAASAVRHNSELRNLYALLVGPEQPEPRELAASVARLS